MLHILNNKSKLMLAAFAMILASCLFIGGEVRATSCEDDNVPCVEVSFGAPQGNLSVQPGLSYYDSTQFYLPVEIGLKSASLYTIKVYGSGSNLTSGTESIPSIGTDTAYTDLGKNGSEWGIRWNLGDTVEDKETNYHKVPASAEDNEAIVVENKYLPKTAAIVKKQLTLGFAVAVGADQPSGSYTNTVTVAVVASPRDARSFFDISTMQEMTPEICANTTTPDKTATTKFDTDASYPEDTSYVPQTTLKDTRDNSVYLVRKLADGNCWMSQNLHLILKTGEALTSDGTDLNSKDSWTPTHTTQTGNGTAWLDSNDHSYRHDWERFWAGGTTFNTTGAPAYGGTAGYAQRGTFYNWFSATAGSGKTTDTITTTDGNRIISGTVQDSICPKGWTLPVGGETAVNVTDGSVKSFYNLVQLYTGKTGDITGATANTLYISPMNFVPSGLYHYSYGTINQIGEIQAYWSGTAGGSAGNAMYLYLLNANTVRPGNYTGYAGHGLTMRCVAR